MFRNELDNVHQLCVLTEIALFQEVYWHIFIFHIFVTRMHYVRRSKGII